MDQEQTDQQQSSDDFNAGFNSVRHSDGYEPPETKETAEAKDEPVATEAETQDKEAEQKPEEPLFAGLTESQIKSLLERSTRVDGIEDQLRKAHGKIGELNGTLQELKSHQSRPTQNAPALDDAQMNEFEKDYPEFVAIAEDRARRIASEMMQQGAQPENIKVELQQEVQLGIMDAMFPDWRDTVNTQDFSLWMATQAPEVQQTYANTWNARELGSVVTGFKTWQQTSNDRATKSKQRLQDAMIPDTKTSRVTHAPTAQDEFIAGFNAVRGNDKR